MSSSSGSSCSSSDESDSEDSNVSGRSSSEKHSTQGWGLANFMEKKNVPPPLRNLSTTVTQPEKQTVFNNSHMDLADEDSVNWILGKYSSTDIKDYLQSPSPQFLDFDAGNLPMNREIQVLLSHVSSPAQEEQFNPKYGSSDVEQITEIHLKVSGQNEMSLGQRFQWSGNNDNDRLIDNDVPKEQQVNVKLDIEENCDATRLEEGPEIEAPQIVHDEFSISFYSCPEVSRSFVPRADCGPLGTNCIQPCYTLENSTISCNIKCSTSPKSNEEVRKGHGDKKPAENKETSKKYNSYYQSVLCFSDNEETECKRYKGKNKTSNLEVKPNSEETQCKNDVVKKSGSKTKPKELVSDTSILERKGLYTFQMSSSSKRKENNTLKGKSDLFSAKNTSSSKSVSISKKQPQKIRETNRPVKPPCFPHVTSVINTVAKGDLSCSNICSNSITRRRSDETTSSLVEFDNKTTVKMDSPKLLSPICIKDTFEACNEVKENAKPCIFVSIGLALITRVPAHPPGKFIQQDSVRDSPRIHLKEIKQDSNRSNDSLNPTCDTLSSVKRKITNSLRQLPCKRKAEENRGERRMVLSPAGSGATGKRRKKEVDIMWNCTPTPKSPGYCDSQNNCSVSSYFSHQSSLNINSWSHNDGKEQCTKHKPKGEVNSTSEAPVSHSSDKKFKKKEKKQGMKSKETRKNMDSERWKIEESSHSQVSVCNSREVACVHSDNKEKNPHTPCSLEHSAKGIDWPVQDQNLNSDQYIKHHSSEIYLNEAKELKHQADREGDRTVQAMQYLEAVLYFTLTGNAMEHNRVDTRKVYTMYKETLGLIRHISSNFQKNQHSLSCENTDRRLAVLSLRCQSLLYLKLYRLRRAEVRVLHKSLNDFQKSPACRVLSHPSPPHPSNYTLSSLGLFSYPSPCHSRSHGSPGLNGIPSPHSTTPSPAGSVGSHSSGYSSSELNVCCSTLQSQNSHSSCLSSGLGHLSSTQYQPTVEIPQRIYNIMQKQNVHLTNLHMCLDLWEQADYLIEYSGSRDFFCALDKSCGHLTLHSSFSDLIHYVRAALYRLKEGT